MIALFYFGIFILAISVFTFIFFFLWSSCEDSLIGQLKSSFHYKPISTTVCLIIIILSLVSIYFGYVTPSPKLCAKYYNEDGTTTTINYSLSGDSIVTNAITYDRIVKIEQKWKMKLRILRPNIKVTYKLNNGKIVEEKYWEFECNFPTEIK